MRCSFCGSVVDDNEFSFNEDYFEDSNDTEDTYDDGEMFDSYSESSYRDVTDQSDALPDYLCPMCGLHNTGLQTPNFVTCPLCNNMHPDDSYCKWCSGYSTVATFVKLFWPYHNRPAIYVLRHAYIHEVRIRSLPGPLNLLSYKEILKGTAYPLLDDETKKLFSVIFSLENYPPRPKIPPPSSESSRQ